MTGLEKITTEIRDEAAAEAAQALAQAKSEADEILAKAKEEADAKTAQIAKDAQADVDAIASSQQSALALQRRQRTLAAKQTLLAETLDKALQSLYALGDGEYFALLVKLAAKAAQPGSGAMLLNAKDKGCLPADFADKLAAALPSGSTLAISDETRPIDGGFVLKYGDVEENGSFKAIFNARSDEFSDLVRDTLFA